MVSAIWSSVRKIFPNVWRSPFSKIWHRNSISSMAPESTQFRGLINLLNSVNDPRHVIPPFSGSHFHMFTMVFFLMRLMLKSCFLLFLFLDSYIQKAKKTFSDARARRNLNVLNNELQVFWSKRFRANILCPERSNPFQKASYLYHPNFYWLMFSSPFNHAKNFQDVQRIMVQNIDDVLQRGVAISELDTKASHLSMASQNYKEKARQLNRNATYAKLAAGGVIILVIFLYFWVF